MRLSAVVRLLLLPVLGFAITGCSDSADPSSGVSGTYQATELTLTDGSGNTDFLAAGAEVSIVLTPTGTTTGSLVVPAAYSESGLEETYSLTGTYAYDADARAVTFDQAADTFLRDITWEVDGRELHGTLAVDLGSTLTATLERGP
jgi:hypothetical protein